MKRKSFFKGNFFGLYMAFVIASNSFGQQIEAHLGGAIFNIHVHEKNPDASVDRWDDLIKFENNKVHSGFAASNGFQPATYSAVMDTTGIIFFSAEVERADGDQLKWSGTVSSTIIGGRADWYRQGNIKTEYVFYGLVPRSAQDTLNQLDSAGQKHGYWILYLDSNLGEIKKPGSDTVYYRYTYYDHGFNVISMGTIGSKKLPCIPPAGLQPDQTGYILLDGEFKSLYKNGNTQFVLKADQGHLTLYEEYYDSGKMSHFFDYTKHWNGRPHTFYSCGFNKKDGSLKWEGYFRQGTLANGRTVWLIWQQ